MSGTEGTDPLTTGEISRGAPNPRTDSTSGGKSKKNDKKGAIRRITSPNSRGEYDEEDTLLTDNSDETSNSSDDKKTNSKKPNSSKIGKILPFQGKNRANMWIETVKTAIPLALEQILDQYSKGSDADPAYLMVPDKYKTLDQELFQNIQRALMDKRADPETEATSLFQKIQSHKGSIGRSGLKTLFPQSAYIDLLRQVA